MHDFEAANSDELELKRGDIVLVVPTSSVEDQVRAESDTLICSNNSMFLREGKRLWLFLWCLLLQEAGWLTGIKESDWFTLGVSAQKGLFPENFTQRLE